MPAEPSPAGLVGLTVAVVGADRGIGARLPARLASRGAEVLAVGADEVGLRRVVDDVVAAGGHADAAPADPAAPGAVRAALGEAGTVDVVVWAHLDPSALVPRRLVELDEEAWDAAAERSIRAVVWGLQAAWDALPDGGRVVLVLPTTAAVGAPGLVPLCTAVESMRVLAKSAARRWGARGITVNTVGVSLADHLGGPDDGSLEVPTLGTASLPSGDAAEDVAALVASLAGPDGEAVTGTFLGADRGEVMLP